MDVKRFKRLPIMGILRGIEFDIIDPLIETVISSGLEVIEITMNTKDAPGLIKKAIKASRGRLVIGAGTVLSAQSLKRALDAGATFIVLPIVVNEVVEHCVSKKIPVFPGAFSAKEIYDAWHKGATMVKVFPAKFLGPDYFKEIKGPFNDIELLACGGVTPENMNKYLSKGASAITFGGSVFRKELLAAKDFDSIKKRIVQYIQKFKKSQN